MAHGRPRSQSRAMMAQKEQIAKQLLGRGLRVSQIAAQLNCSTFFVRKVRESMAIEADLPRAS